MSIIIDRLKDSYYYVNANRPKDGSMSNLQAMLVDMDPSAVTPARSFYLQIQPSQANVVHQEHTTPAIDVSIKLPSNAKKSWTKEEVIL